MKHDETDRIMPKQSSIGKCTGGPPHGSLIAFFRMGVTRAKDGYDLRMFEVVEFGVHKGLTTSTVHII